MATSKSSKKRKQAQRKHQAQHRQAHAVEKARERDSQREHLPKTGTSADDDYLLRRRREDLVDFGLTRVKGGVVNWIIGVVVVAALLGLMIILVTRSG